ncbi:MAG: hypothetical protein C4291_06640 [Candidatus Dadabacteria bacterium]
MISLLNVLNLISVLFSLLFHVLLVRLFGVALQTDVYYLCTAIIQFTVGIVAFLIKLYIPVYNDVKVRSEEEAKNFTGAVLVLIFLMGAFFSILVFVTAPYIVKIFANGFSPEKISLSARLVRVLSVSILFSSLTMVVTAALIANLFMLITFSSSIITPLFNLIALLLFVRNYGIVAIMYSIVTASIINFLVVSAFLRMRVGWKLANPFKRPDIAYLVRQSISMRMGGVIAELQGPITSNILSYFPTGYITLFSYTNRLLNVLFNIINSPILQVLYSKSSNLLARKRVDELKGLLISTLMSNTVLFISVIIPLIILFKKIFSLLFAPKVTSNEISVMYHLFLALIPFYLALSFEVSFAVITIAMKKGIEVLKINVVFTFLYGVFFIPAIKFLAIFAIPIALFIAEVYKSIVFINLVDRDMHIVDLDMIKNMIKFSVFIGLLVSLNVLFASSFIYGMYLNVILVILWLIFMGKDTIAAFHLIVRKGEVK